MNSEISAAFTLTGKDLDPEHVTLVTGISPSKTWRTGELVTDRARVRYEDNGWAMESDLPDSSDLEQHVGSVLSKLQPAWSSVVQLSDRYDAEISCVVYSHGGARPPLHFSRDLVERIAELRCSIDIDLYVLP